jgi:hypothetical protein
VDPLGFMLAAILSMPNPLPPLSDTLYLPPHQVCRDNRMAASTNYNRLRNEWNDGPDQWWYDLAVTDARRRWVLWDVAEDAASPHFYEVHRREKLRLLRDLLGPADYRRMILPEPVAGWHLADETTLPRRSHEPPPLEETPD